MLYLNTENTTIYSEKFRVGNDVILIPTMKPLSE